MISKDEFCLFAELIIRLYVLILLIIGICLMPMFTGYPAYQWIIPLDGITIGLTGMWSTGTFLRNGIIPLDTIILYGIVPTFALVFLTWNFLRWLNA